MSIDRSTPPLQSLYQEVILEHYRRPRNRGSIEEPTAEVHMRNPVCGDEIVLQILVRDGMVEEVRFSGQGCSISQASASMMTQLLKGKSVEEAEALKARFTQMMHGDADAAKDRAMGDLRALSGVSRFPARIKCALLAWDALGEAGKAAAGGGDSGPAAG
jgi:nitrogen fixation protein NifU and related proteins